MIEGTRNEAIAKRDDVPQAKAGDMLSSLIEIVQETVAAGEEVQLIGFGTFAAKERPARIGRNPQTGGTLEIKASRTPVFKAGKPFKDALNR